MTEEFHHRHRHRRHHRTTAMAHAPVPRPGGRAPHAQAPRDGERGGHDRAERGRERRGSVRRRRFQRGLGAVWLDGLLRDPRLLARADYAARPPGAPRNDTAALSCLSRAGAQQALTVDPPSLTRSLPPSPDRHQAILVDDFVKGLFALIAVMADFMASAPKVVVAAVLGGAALAVCGMCTYCCACHKSPEDVVDSDDDEGEGGSGPRGPAAFRAKPPEPQNKRAKQHQPQGDVSHNSDGDGDGAGGPTLPAGRYGRSGRRRGQRARGGEDEGDEDGSGLAWFMCAPDEVQMVLPSPLRPPPGSGVRHVVTPALPGGGALGVAFELDAAHGGAARVRSLAAGSPLVGLVWPGEFVRYIDGEAPDGVPPASLSERLDALSDHEHSLFVEVVGSLVCPWSGVSVVLGVTASRIPPARRSHEGGIEHRTSPIITDDATTLMFHVPPPSAHVRPVLRRAAACLAAINRRHRRACRADSGTCRNPGRMILMNMKPGSILVHMSRRVLVTAIGR